jgi:hypothetical protein
MTAGRSSPPHPWPARRAGSLAAQALTVQLHLFGCLAQLVTFDGLALPENSSVGWRGFTGPCPWP